MKILKKIYSLTEPSMAGFLNCFQVAIKKEKEKIIYANNEVLTAFVIFGAFPKATAHRG